MVFGRKLALAARSYLPYIAGIGGSVVVAVSMFPETFMLNTFRKYTHYVEKDGSERKIDPNTQDLIDRVLLRISLQPKEEVLLDFYVSGMADPSHYGSSKMRFGGIIGLPVSFQYGETIDLTKETISYSGIRLALGDGASKDEAIQQLTQSFLLSNKAKAFLIAREIYYVSNNKLHFDVFLKSFSCCAAFVTCHFFEVKMPAISSRLKGWAKLSCFGAICAAWGVLYLALHDAHRCWLDYTVDKKTAKLGRSFVEGGVEYYESTLKRNMALRSLMSSGPKRFTPYGNEISTFRQKSLQATSRRDNLSRLLENYKKEDVTTPTAPEGVAPAEQ